VAHDVTIIGEYNLAGTVPYHASQMFARNITSFLLHLVKRRQAATESSGRNNARNAGDTRWRDCERAHKGIFLDAGAAGAPAGGGA